MNLQQFLRAQVDAAGRKGHVLDGVREALTEGDMSPDCIAFVLGRLGLIFDKHPGVAAVKDSRDAADAARKCEQLFRPLVGDLEFELVKALAVIWMAGPEAVAAMQTE